MFQFPIHQTARNISFSLFSLPQHFQQPNNEKIGKKKQNPCFRVSFVLPWREPDRELRVRPWGAWSRRRPQRPPLAACFGWKPKQNPSFCAQAASDISELCSSSSVFEKWERIKEPQLRSSESLPFVYRKRAERNLNLLVDQCLFLGWEFSY
jgi:hypothetical protein